MLSYVPQLHNTELCSIRHPSYTTAKSVSALSPKRSSELPEVASTLGTSSSTGPAKEVDRLNRPPLGLPCSKDNTSFLTLYHLAICDGDALGLALTLMGLANGPCVAHIRSRLGVAHISMRQPPDSQGGVLQSNFALGLPCS